MRACYCGHLAFGWVIRRHFRIPAVKCAVKIMSTLRVGCPWASTRGKDVCAWNVHYVIGLCAFNHYYELHVCVASLII